MNPSTALATVLVDELIRCGVRDAVLCPGSRSAPFAYALQAAERAGRLRLHVRVDERSAGFLALGLAKGALPVPVFTTSGTAVANLHPAVLEAHHAGVALLVVSADRPPELRDTGANQTTDQAKIFGDAVRWFHELGAPERRPGQDAVWRSVACRAWDAAAGLPAEGDAGPVHLNVPLREPLVPDVRPEPAGSPDAAGTPATAAAECDWPEPLEGRPDGRPWVVRHLQPERAVPVEPQPRTLVVIGELPQHRMYDVVARVAQVGWPVVAEPFGRFDRSTVVPHGPLLLTAEDWVERHLPERVLVVGRVTLSRPVQALLRRKGIRVELVQSRRRWPDPAHVAERVHPISALMATDGATRAQGSSSERTADRAWAAAWAEAGERVHAAAQEVVDDSWPSGLAVAATVLSGLPRGSTLFVGSSKTVRDLDLAVSCAAAEDLLVVANRGLAGIDGCVSTAVGVALSGDRAREESPAATADGVVSAERQRPSYGLMGDLTFLHDTNGLLIGPDEPRPDLTIVVVNDDGGGIFTTLEPGSPERAGEFERVFGTPTGTSITDLCRAHGVPHERVTSREGLARAVGEPPSGLRVVEVPVPRDTHRDLEARLRAAARRPLAD